MIKPIKLEKPPIVEAVAEIKFQNDLLQSAVIFGSLYSKLSALMPETEALQILEMPSNIIDTQPELKYAVHYRMKGGNFLVGIGKRILSVNYVCFNYDYDKWSKFKDIIDKVLNEFSQTNLISEIESVSVRYINLFDKSKEIDKLFNVGIDIGSSHLPDYKNINIAATKEDGGISSTVQIGTNAILSSPLEKLEGTLLVIELSKKETMKIDDASSSIELLHSTLEAVFFDTMSDDYINELGPVYE